jgi:DNA polymerase elongation subunit (family B)
MRDDINTSAIVFDLETAGHPDADCYLEPVQPAKNLVDPAKVQADIEKRTQERLDKIALDWNVGRIVALGWWTEEHGTEVVVCADEMQERNALGRFWSESRHRTLVGYNAKGFDCPYLIQRSRLLGVPHPVSLDLGKYSERGVIDLFLRLTFNNGTYDQGAMRRTLKAFCRRFGIDVDDDVNGSEIPALVAAGDWKAVEAHCRADIGLTVALARKLGVVRVQEPALF